MLRLLQTENATEILCVSSTKNSVCVYRTCSVFFLIAEENSVRDLAGTLYDQMTQMTINGGFEKVIK